jgi:hypothetical protein
MANVQVDHKKLKIHNPVLCGQCTLGACCRFGVEVDLFEAADILRMDLGISKPCSIFCAATGVFRRDLFSGRSCATGAVSFRGRTGDAGSTPRVRGSAVNFR